MSTYAYRQAAGIRQALLDRRELALIDVREEADFATAHPLFAVNLPLSKLELEVRRRIPRFTTPLTVYDNGEGLAEIAIERLRSWGYQDVALLAEGLAGWSRSGGELFQDVNSASKAFGELVESVRHTPSLSAQEVQALIDSRQEVVIVDARRFDEYQTMSIPGSISRLGGELALRVESLTPSPQTPVIVNCAGRTRSIIGTQSLINAGVPNPVHALRNGTIGWTLAGQTLAHQQQRQYDPSARASGARAAEVAHFAERAGVAVIDEATLQRWQQQSDRTTFLFDVRSPEECAAGHYPGSLSAPGGSAMQETDHFASVMRARYARIKAKLTTMATGGDNRLVAGADGLGDGAAERAVDQPVDRTRGASRRGAARPAGGGDKPGAAGATAGRTRYGGARFYHQRQLCRSPYPRRVVANALAAAPGPGSNPSRPTLHGDLRQQSAGPLRGAGGGGLDR